MSFHERKAARKELYLKYEYKWKQQKCTACNGSGYYDHNGSPKCGGCDGTGKERVSPGKLCQLFVPSDKNSQVCKCGLHVEHQDHVARHGSPHMRLVRESNNRIKQRLKEEDDS